MNEPTTETKITRAEIARANRGMEHAFVPHTGAEVAALSRGDVVAFAHRIEPAVAEALEQRGVRLHEAWSGGVCRQVGEVVK